jgi:hypothetical protein
VVLDRPQNLFLDFQGNVADFVQEERSPVGRLKAPGPALQRAGESPAFIPKKLRFDQRRRQG